MNCDESLDKWITAIVLKYRKGLKESLVEQRTLQARNIRGTRNPSRALMAKIQLEQKEKS